MRPLFGSRHALLFVYLLVALGLATRGTPASAQVFGSDKQYVVIGWNDLGMHCMNPDYSSIGVLPPFNNIWAQVVKRGDPPQLVSTSVTLSYRFPLNTTSSNKVNFWPAAQKLFGLAHPLPNDIGLTGNGLSGVMAWNGTAFVATGVPLTPFEDAAPTVQQPYQIAEVTLRDASSSLVLDVTQFVAPVAVEMHCDRCHAGNGEPRAGAASNGKSVYDNILRYHDSEEGTHLSSSKPVLCASCHSSNALGTPGQPGLRSLSQALHGKHASEAPGIGCYDCHPGEQTQCLRGAMILHGKWCTDCHGSLAQVASSVSAGRRPWLDEPKCATCHPFNPEETNTLYRNSKGHGGLYCEACHDSTHSELPTNQYRDSLQVYRLQGNFTYLKDCMVCHTKAPVAAGPHGLLVRNSAKRSSWEILK